MGLRVNTYGDSRDGARSEIEWLRLCEADWGGVMIGAGETGATAAVAGAIAVGGEIILAAIGGGTIGAAWGTIDGVTIGGTVPIIGWPLCCMVTICGCCGTPATTAVGIIVLFITCGTVGRTATPPAGTGITWGNCGLIDPVGVRIGVPAFDDSDANITGGRVFGNSKPRSFKFISLQAMLNSLISIRPSESVSARALKNENKIIFKLY